MKTLARDARQLGNLIRRARKQQTISQKVLGDRAGLRQETISLLETGNPAARGEIDERIAGVFGFTGQL